MSNAALDLRMVDLIVTLALEQRLVCTRATPADQTVAVVTGATRVPGGVALLTSPATDAATPPGPDPRDGLLSSALIGIGELIARGRLRSITFGPASVDTTVSYVHPHAEGSRLHLTVYAADAALSPAPAP